MLAQHTASLLATPTDQAAVGHLMTEPEAPLSDAPMYTPQAAGVLLLLVLLSPNEPRDK